MRLLLFLMMALTFSFCANPDSSTAENSESQATEQTETPTATPTTSTGGNVGDKAPTFNLKGIDGQSHSFETIKDANGQDPKGYIVVFTCNTCPVAKSNETRLIELHNQYAAKGYPVVAIQPNDPAVKPGDSYESMISYAAEKGFPFTYLFDDGQKIYPQYGATKTPEVYLVDKDLTVRYHGAIDDNARDEEGVSEKFLEMAIEALEKGEEPKPAETKAVGCSIKTA